MAGTDGSQARPVLLAYPVVHEPGHGGENGIDARRVITPRRVRRIGTRANSVSRGAGRSPVAEVLGRREREVSSTGCRTGVNGGLEHGPARKAEFAGDDELRGSEADCARWRQGVMVGESLHSLGIAALGRVA